MKKNLSVYILLVLVPFLILSPYTFQILEVGNDFELYYFTYKKYIFEILKLGHLPLWSPVEASGTSLIFNPLTQYFYLPTWFFYFFCYLLGDLTKYYFLIYTVSAISIFNLGLFFYFKTLKINTKIAITTIIITCLSLKINELLRFPNAIHSFAWFSWMLYGINLAALNGVQKKSFFTIFFSSLMIFTAGYPYYIFYGFVIFSIYFFFLTINPIKKKIFGDNIGSNIQFFFKCFFPSCFALLVAAPWLLKINQLISITHGRNDTDITFSLSGTSNIYDHVGSWIYPPFSIAEGWFYFGAISVFIIITIFLYNIIFNRELFLKNYPYKYFSILLIFLIFFSYQISNSVDSLIFSFLWKNIDFIQNFRQFIRFNIILVPFISLVLALSITEFIRVLNNNVIKNKAFSLIVLFSFLFILTIQIFLIYFSNYQNNYWETWQLKRIVFAEEKLTGLLSYFVGLYKNLIYPIFFTISVLVILIIIESTYVLNSIRRNISIFLYTVIIVSFAELFFLTNIQWAIPFNYYNLGYKTLDLEPNYNIKNNDALKDISNGFKLSRVSAEKSGNNTYEGNTYYRHNKKFNINHINNWGNENHVKIFQMYFETNGKIKDKLDDLTKKNVKQFFGLNKKAKRIFFTKSFKYEDVNNFILDSNRDEVSASFSYENKYYNGDQLIIEIQSNSSGWVSFIDTWDHNWNVYVNSRQMTLRKLFGAYKSIKVEPGVSTIEFIYKPFNLNFKR